MFEIVGNVVLSAMVIFVVVEQVSIWRYVTKAITLGKADREDVFLLLPLYYLPLLVLSIAKQIPASLKRTPGTLEDSHERNEH